MTADRPLRDQLIARLRDADLGDVEAGETVDLLLPLIEADRERAAAEGGAEALETFVNGIYLDEGSRYEDRARIVADGLRRAAALRATDQP